MPKPEALQVVEALVKICDQTSPMPDPREKVESAYKRIARKDRNLTEEIREWVLSSNDEFLSSDVRQCLVLSSREDQKLIWWVLNEMVKEGLIERAGNRNGCYRRIQRESENIDFLNAPTETVDVRWPFGIERYMRVLPKNIVCVAGEPDAGKTAFLLNFTKMNMDRHDIRFYSSEMGPIEFKDRLSNFGIPLKDWKFAPKERASHFADVIVPDAINIIDYLEIHDEFYKVGAYIKQIFDRLDKGLALIAIQKNRGSTYGLGGGRGVEKARLYLTMGQGRIKMIKAKNWVDQKTNPNGLELDFKLAKGCHFIAENDWHRGEDIA